MSTKIHTQEWVERLDAHQRWWQTSGKVGEQLVLRDADLTGLDLAGISLARCVIERVDLSRVSLRGAHLTNSKLSDSRLTGADLADAWLSNTRLTRVDLSGADLSRADLDDLELQDCNLRSAKLAEANLNKSEWRDSDLSEASLEGARLQRATMERVSFRGADLRASNWTHAILHDVDVRDAQLRGARFHKTSIDGIRVAGARGFWARPEDNRFANFDFSAAGDGSDLRPAAALIDSVNGEMRPRRVELAFGMTPILRRAEPGTLPVPLAIEELPLSAALRQRLADWGARFDNPLGHELKPNGDLTDETTAAIDSEGEAITQLLQSELGADYEILYVRLPTV